MATSLINLRTDLKSLNWGSEKPIITKDINNPPSQTGIISEFTHREDDTVRITKLLTQRAGLKWVANQAILEQAGNSGPSDLTFAEISKYVAKTLKETTVGVGKVTASTLAQIPVSGTGIHIERGFVPVKYLTDGGAYNGEDKGYVQDVVNKIANRFNLFQISSVPETELSLYENYGKYLLNSQPKQDEESKIDDLEKGTENSTTFNSETGLKTDTFLGPGQNSKLYEKLGEKHGKSLISFKDTKLGIKKELDITQGDQITKKISDVNPSEFKGENDYSKEKVLSAKWGTKGRPRLKGDDIPRPDELQSLGILTEQLEVKEEDIIPFKFKIITPEDTEGKYLYFRAFLDSFSENYNGNWQGTRYIGRAEEFFTYESFSRNIDFSFKIAAFSELEMKPLYKKLNYLVGTTAPTYGTEKRFMRGTLTQITVGDYIINQPGIIRSIGIDWQKEYPWEISTSTIRVPHILDVNISFTPIHTFNVASNNFNYISPKVIERDNNYQPSQELDSITTPSFIPEIDTTSLAGT